MTLAEAYALVTEQIEERQRKEAEHIKQVREWIEKNTCPHCGECPPLPRHLER